MHARGSRSIKRCREAIEDPGTFSIDPPSYRGSVEIAIRNNLRARQIARCQDCIKISFSRGEKHKYECNQACNSTKDPISILSSQNHLSTTIFSTKIPKTHTHTLNKSNQFYISKTKLRQFSEHTLTYVKLVMAKSHCTCTCIKSSKEYCMLCVKNIARLHKCQLVMTI